MGLTKTFTDSSGNTHAYWKPGLMSFCYDKDTSANSCLNLEMLGFKTQSDRNSGKDPSIRGAINFFGTDYPLDPAKLQVTEVTSYAISTNYAGDINEITFDTNFGLNIADDGDRVILHIKSGDTGTVPSGTTEDKVYWIKFNSDGAGELHNSKSDALTGTSPVDIGADVSGTVQIQLAPNDVESLCYDKIGEGSLTGTVTLEKGEGKFDLSTATPDA
jgi:hypothetical protein